MFTVVEVGAVKPVAGTFWTVNTWGPAGSQVLYLCPRATLPTDLPSIRRLKPRFHPKFGVLSTTRRPGGKW
jgi:hypothetical protein